MTVEQIFSKISAHMLQGLMFHEQTANYYDFLGLKGYKRMHEYHYFEESVAFRKLNRYFINNHCKLIEESEIEDPKVIPRNWYNYKRDDVDPNTKRNSIKTSMEAWKVWEAETLELYEKSYKELISIDEVATALFIKDLIYDVEHELKYVKRKILDLDTIEYDFSVIIPCQEELHELYRRKTRELTLDFEY